MIEVRVTVRQLDDDGNEHARQEYENSFPDQNCPVVIVLDDGADIAPIIQKEYDRWMQRFFSEYIVITPPGGTNA